MHTIEKQMTENDMILIPHIIILYSGIRVYIELQATACMYVCNVETKKDISPPYIESNKENKFKK